MKAQVMTTAHAIAKAMPANTPYKVRFAQALKQAWAAAKAPKADPFEPFTDYEYTGFELSVWENKRVYIREVGKNKYGKHVNTQIAWIDPVSRKGEVLAKSNQNGTITQFLRDAYEDKNVSPVFDRHRRFTY